VISVFNISNEMIEILRRYGNKAVTLKWEQFYTLTNRDQLHEEFLDEVTIELKKHGVRIIYGSNVVIVVRDFCWFPVDL